MTQSFLALECPRCGGRLKASSDPQLFTCLHCEFDVLLQPGRPVSNTGTTGSAIDSADESTAEPPEWLLRHRARLELLKADRNASKAMVTGFGIGCLVNTAIAVGLVWLDITSFSWMPLLGASVCLLLFIITVIGMRAHLKAMPIG